MTRSPSVALNRFDFGILLEFFVRVFVVLYLINLCVCFWRLYDENRSHHFHLILSVKSCKHIQMPKFFMSRKSTRMEVLTNTSNLDYRLSCMSLAILVSMTSGKCTFQFIPSSVFFRNFSLRVNKNFILSIYLAFHNIDLMN